jgi:PII-like signaling protein
MGAAQYRAMSSFCFDGVLNGTDLTPINSQLSIITEFVDTAEGMQEVLI